LFLIVLDQALFIKIHPYLLLFSRQKKYNPIFLHSYNSILKYIYIYISLHKCGRELFNKRISNINLHKLNLNRLNGPLLIKYELNFKLIRFLLSLIVLKLFRFI